MLPFCTYPEQTPTTSNVVREWSLTDYQLITQWSPEETGLLRDALYLPSNRVATVGGDAVVRIWSEDRTIENELYGHRDTIMTIALSNDGRTIASGGFDSSVFVWDVSSGLILREYEAHSSLVRGIDFAPDDQTIVSVGVDTVGHIWRLATGETELYLVGHGPVKGAFGFTTDQGRLPKEGLFSGTFSPDGRFIVTGGIDGVARVWDIQSRTFGSHQGTVNAVAFSPNSQQLLTGGADTTVRLWNINTGEAIRTYVGNQYTVYDVDFSEDGQYIYSGGRDGAARIWSIGSSTVQRQFPADNWNPNISPSIYSLALTGDASTIVTSDEMGRLIYYDVLTQNLINEFRPLTDIYEIALSPDEEYIAVGGYADALIKILITETGEEVRWFSSHPISLVWTLSFSPDGELLAAGFEDGTIRVFNIKQYREVAVLSGHINAVTSMAFSPDGRYLFSGSLDTTARLWDIDSGDELRQINWHTGGILDVDYSNDGRWLATAATDGYVRLWDSDYNDLIDYACNRISRDLTSDERRIYVISDVPTCGDFTDILNGIPPTWTPNPVVVEQDVILVPTVLPTLVPSGFVNNWSSLGRINYMIYSPDDRYIYTGSSYGRTITVLESATLSPIQTFEISGLLDIGVSPDGNWLIAIDEYDDSGLNPTIYNARTGELATRDIVEQYQGYFTNYTSDGRVPRILRNSEGSYRLVISDGVSDEEIAQIPNRSSYTLSLDGEIIAYIGTAQFGGIFSRNTLDAINFHLISGRRINPIALEISPSKLSYFNDSRRLLVEYDNGLMQVWNVSNTSLIYEINLPILDTQEEGQIHSTFISNNDQYLLVIPYGNRNHLEIYDAQHGQLVGYIENDNGIYTPVVSNNGQFILISDGQGQIESWRIADLLID